MEMGYCEKHHVVYWAEWSRRPAAPRGQIGERGTCRHKRSSRNGSSREASGVDGELWRG